MLTGIDHLVVAVDDLDASVGALEAGLGLVATSGGRHERLGTENRLVWLGDTYLELLAVRDPERAAASWLGAPSLRALAAGGGFVTWAVATDAIDAEIELAAARGLALAGPLDGERLRPDGRVVRWRLAHPARLGPLEPPFVIQHDTGAAEWTSAERAERARAIHPAGGRARVERLEIPVPETNRSSLRFLPLGIGPFRPSLAGRGTRDAAIGPQTLRLVPVAVGAGEAPPEPTIALRIERTDGAAPAPGVREERLLGCRWLVREVAG